MKNRFIFISPNRITQSVSAWKQLLEINLGNHAGEVVHHVRQTKLIFVRYIKFAA